jgi:hypothetical protein
MLEPKPLLRRAHTHLVAYCLIALVMQIAKRFGPTGSNISYPPLTRLVCQRFVCVVGWNIKNPPLTRWV